METIRPIGKSGLTIQQEFEEFHRLNPGVANSLLNLALQAHARGRKVGIRLLFERLRWEYLMTTDDPFSDFKLNDHYHSRYARLLVNLDPRLDGMFQFRKLRTA